MYCLQSCLLEGVRTPGSVVTDNCELPYRCFALKPGLMMEWMRQILCRLLLAVIYSWELTLMTQSPRAPCLKTVIMDGRLPHRLRGDTDIQTIPPSHFLLNANIWHRIPRDGWEHSPTITPEGGTLGLSKLHTECLPQNLLGHLTPGQSERGIGCTKGLCWDGHRQWRWQPVKRTTHWKVTYCHSITCLCKDFHVLPRHR